MAVGSLKNPYEFPYVGDEGTKAEFLGSSTRHRVELRRTAWNGEVWYWLRYTLRLASNIPLDASTMKLTLSRSTPTEFQLETSGYCGGSGDNWTVGASYCTNAISVGSYGNTNARFSCYDTSAGVRDQKITYIP